MLRGVSRDEDEVVAGARAAWLREIEVELPQRAREVLAGRRPDGRRWSRRQDTLCWRMRGEQNAVFFKLGDLAHAARPTGLPTPRVLASGRLCSGSFVLITEEAAGTRARDLVGTPRAAGLVSALARALREVHAGPCLPGAPRLDPEELLHRAQRRFAAGLVPEESFSSRYGPVLDLARRPAELERLARALPALPPGGWARLHGDPCLPNLFLDEQDRVTAWIDLDLSGEGDPAWDLALASWSIRKNLGPEAAQALLGCFPEVPPERVQWMAALSRFLR